MRILQLLSIFRYNLRKRVTKSDAIGVEHGILNCVLVPYAEIHSQVLVILQLKVK